MRSWLRAISSLLRSSLIEAQGSGHSALATMLDDINVDALICGGIGNGAMEALVQMGIEVCSGVSGDADEAVAEYLNGSLESQGVNCDHHNNGEEHSCGHCGSDEEDCGCGSCGDDDGHGCGGCSGCGGSYTPPFDGPNVGKTCRVHYKGTFNDGTQFDSSYDRGEPLEFVCGAGMMILGFDRAVAAMNVGDVIDVHLMPSEAYGEVEPEAFITERGRYRDFYAQFHQQLLDSDKALLSGIFDAKLYSRQTYAEGELRIWDKNKKLHYYTYYSTRISTIEGEKIMLLLRNIDDKKQQEHELALLSADRMRHHNIANALAEMYYSVYYVGSRLQSEDCTRVLSARRL